MKGPTSSPLRRWPALLAVTLLLIAAAWATETGRCLRVIDGDTIKVRLGCRTETVRLIGVDTPETVHPSKPVEYFGREAFAFAKRMAEGQVMRLEGDPETANHYGCVLRYDLRRHGQPRS